MAFNNLPGIFDYKVDGNLGQLPLNSNPVVLVIGTAESGPSETPFVISSMANVTKTFGSLGTLARGCFEAAASGALNIVAFRIGATSAKLASIGIGGTIETVMKDDQAGLSYSLFYDDTAKRIKVYRVSDSTLVYDNSPTNPDTKVDLGEISFTGSFSGTAGDIGTSTVPVTMAAANSVSGAVYTAGTDGTSLSKMKLWECLYNAYQLLEDYTFDFVVPMGVYLDDRNTQDMTTAQVTALQTGAPWASAGNTYPTANTSFDVLGKVYVENYQGKNYFWWDLNRTASADLWPVGVGSSSATVTSSGHTLATGDYHEVNFAYDLAHFCFAQSENTDECLGVIGVNPPNSLSLADVASWVGSAPVSALSGSNQVITSNGTGLLGNKFMAGRLGDVGTGLPSFAIGGVDGLAGGGFIAKDGSQFLDGATDLKDANAKLVDIGKYISVLGAQPILTNPARDVSYIASGASAYAGFVSTLAPNSAPTNKVIGGVQQPFKLSLTKLDALAGSKYVMFQTKAKGIVVSDAPTAARTQSDYNRLSTVRIVKAVLDAVRSAGDPFIGESISGARMAALDTAIEQALAKLTKAGYLQRYQHQVTSTPADQVLGHANVDLILIPAFELRQINVTVSLRSS
jgi:hypothetical protein